MPISQCANSGSTEIVYKSFHYGVDKTAAISSWSHTLLNFFFSFELFVTRPAGFFYAPTCRTIKFAV